MFGTQGIHQYNQVGLETGVAAANPIKLIVMLYDGAIAACHAALPYVQRNEYVGRSDSIFKAIRIIQSGLRLSLNKQEGGKIAENLDALYVYMINRLIKANIDNDAAPIHEVAKLLGELREAWDLLSQNEALVQQTTKRLATHDIAHMEKV